MRTLILIPIIHTEHDMGSLSAQIKQAYVERHGVTKWDEHLRSIDAIWNEIRRLIELLDLPYQHVRLYQDGMPECGREAEIVTEVAQQGSKNHQLLLDLIEKGATVMGTEDPTLLLQEYRIHQEALQPRISEATKLALEQQGAHLLAERDRHIAARISQTLSPGEIGLLFLGLSHSAHVCLDRDIIFRSLFPTDVFKKIT